MTSPYVYMAPAAVPRSGDRYTRADLIPAAEAAADARRLTRDTLTCWDLAALTDDAEAIASELAANAIAAAIPPDGPLPYIIFALHDRPPELRIIAWDNGPGQPCALSPGTDAETGRGLAIIDHLTGHNWGWWPTPDSGGKVVWASLTTAQPAPHPASGT
jgi:hypothetical protein